MKVRKLTSKRDGAILATIRLDSGEILEVVFSTERRDDIVVANPDQALFDREPLDAAGIREIIAAVIAFDRVASRSSDDQD
ncbi:hypothetical protein [Cellulomonas cellasea]|uniref:Putative ATPase n=1 Tax=Cellulomonas cellasea TaxID=43670 RepID=A0A7W4YBC4_9CELL|nr:hypothetical protein [Cellulomonas cellasea]MBB2923755.1 putative ATPase [Cellulomonas cellasea]